MRVDWYISVLHHLFLSVMCVVCFFFFKQKTAYEMRISDWSSDVCSSDLRLMELRYAHRDCHCRDYHGDADEVAHSEETYCPAMRGRSTLQPAEIGRASCRERVCQYV